MEKEEIIREVQQASSVLPIGDIEFFYNDFIKETDIEYLDVFCHSKKNMVESIINKLRRTNDKQAEEFLFRMKEAAETRLARRQEIMDAISDLEMDTIETKIPVVDINGLWESYLLRIFIDRFGCLSNITPIFDSILAPEENTYDGEEEECTSEYIEIWGPTVFASACARMFQSAYFMVRAKCDEYEEELRTNGRPKEDIRYFSDAYGYGISVGIRQTFRNQHFEEIDSGLNFIVPQPIRDYKAFIDDEADMYNMLVNPYPPPELYPAYTKGIDLGQTLDLTNPST